MEINFNASMIKNKEDVKTVLDYTINESRLALERSSKDGEPNWDHEMACMVCCSILGNIGIKCDILPIDKQLFNHSLVMTRFKLDGVNKYYILDPVYEKFLVLKNLVYKALRLKMEKTSRGKELIEQLINDGYFEYNETDMKLYGDSLVAAQLLMARDKETGISGSEYFDEIRTSIFVDENVKRK